MNLPNKITISRIFLIPIFLMIMLVPILNGEIYILRCDHACYSFCRCIDFYYCSTTDWIDGYYARNYNIVTNLGKFLDPLADKLLVSAALIVLVELQMCTIMDCHYHY